MARIRTVKPEFWTDSKMVNLSPLARLMFVGSWNVADDFGCLSADAVELKLRVLPAEPCNAEELVDELLKVGVLEELVSADGVLFWHVTNWEKHQRVEKPGKPTFGLPDSWRPLPEPSPNGGGTLRTDGKGKEGNGSSRRQAAQEGLWTALENTFGPVSPNHRSRRGRIVKGLRALGAAPEDIQLRHDAWELLFPGTKYRITDTALEKWWHALGTVLETAGRKYPDCELCDNRRVVGVLDDGSLTTLDDLAMKTTTRCRCVKGATK